MTYKLLDISNKNLKSFPKNLPEMVNGNFNYYNNHLTSLKGSPKYSKMGLFCWNNRLISLDFLPVKVRMFSSRFFPDFDF